MNARYTSPFSYYRDPREDERAIGALVGVGRPPAGPSDEQRAIALQGLVRAAQPAEDTGPDPRAELIAAERAKAAGALVAAQPEPETAPVQQPDPAAVEAAQERRAASALARLAQEQEETTRLATESPASEPPPDTEAEANTAMTLRGASALAQRHQQQAEAKRLAAESEAAEEPAEAELTRQGTASSTAALARIGRTAAAKNATAAKNAVLKAAGLPFDEEFTVEETDANGGRDPFPGMKLSADRNRPVVTADMNKVRGKDEVDDVTGDMGLDDPAPAGLRDLVRRTDVPEPDPVPAVNDLDRPKQYMKLAADPNPPKRVPSAEGEAAAIKQPSKPNPELEAAVASERAEDAGSSRRDPVEQAIKTAGDNATTPSADGGGMDLTKDAGAVAAGTVPKASPRPAVEAAARTIATNDDDDPGPQLNGWMLAADLLNNGGKNMSSIIAQHEQAKAAWKARRDGLSEREYQHGRDAKGDEFRERQFSAQEAERKADREHANRTSDMSEWHLTDASQRDWEAKENERKRNEAMDAERKTDNTARDRGLTETERHNKAVEANYGAGARDTRELKKQEHELLHGAVPGIKINDTKAWEAATTTAGARAKAMAARQALGGAVEALREMYKIREKIGVGNPQTNAADITSFEQAKKRYVGALGAAAGSGVLQPSEYKTYSEGVPEVTFGARDVGDAIYNRFADKPQDTGLEKLSGAIDDMLARTNAVLGTFGGEYEPIAPASEKQPPNPAREETAPPTGDDDGERALTPEEAAETYHVKATMPDGTKIDKVVPLTEALVIQRTAKKVHSMTEAALEQAGPPPGNTLPVTDQKRREVLKVNEALDDELNKLIGDLGVVRKTKR